MPNLFLDPIAENDAAGKPTGKVTDPAADIAAFLLGVPADWQPENVPRRELSADDEQALEELTAIWLTPSFPQEARREVRSRRHSRPSYAKTVKADERELLAGHDDARPTARSSSSSTSPAARSAATAASAATTFPGFEDAKPIGTPLADWGRKDPSQLAFENIRQFLDIARHRRQRPACRYAPRTRRGARRGRAVRDRRSDHPTADEHGAEHDHLDPLTIADTTSASSCSRSISHQRNGFLWQKLRMPRSFDYQTTRNKRYDERLRMPQVPVQRRRARSGDDVRAGLTNEAPAERYIYQAQLRARRRSSQGRHVLDKFNCAGCHMLDMERWDVAFAADWFEAAARQVTDFPFLEPQSTAEADRGVADARSTAACCTPTCTACRCATKTTGRAATRRSGRRADRAGRHGIGAVSSSSSSISTPSIAGSTCDASAMQNLLIPAKRGRPRPGRRQGVPGVGGDLAKYLFRAVDRRREEDEPGRRRAGGLGLAAAAAA